MEFLIRLSVGSVAAAFLAGVGGSSSSIIPSFLGLQG